MNDKVHCLVGSAQLSLGPRSTTREKLAFPTGPLSSHETRTMHKEGGLGLGLGPGLHFRGHLSPFCPATSKAGVALTVTINRVLYQSRELLEKLKWRATFKCTATGKQAPSLWQEGFPQSLGPSGFPGSNNLSQAVMTKDFQKSCTQQPAVHFHSTDHLRGQGSSWQLCI